MADQTELHLLQSLSKTPPFDPPLNCRSMASDQFKGPSVDLELSISVIRPIQPSRNCRFSNMVRAEARNIDALKWQTAEQFRLADIEKAYAERVRELTRREMELAQSEFARARSLWEKAREEVERVERMKEISIDKKCMKITCQACRQRFSF